MSNLLYKRGWDLLPNIISKEEAKDIKIKLIEDSIKKTGGFYPTFDKERGNVLMYYCPAYCVSLAKKIHKIMEEKLQEELLPTYWFATSYFDDSYMIRHKDRPSCEISVSMNIYSSNITSPLMIEDLEGKTQGIYTEPGSATSYLGTEVYHWRDPMKLEPREAFIQAFFHYVRKNGQYSKYEHDQNRASYLLWNY